jgi:hypothetical protein
MGKKFTVMIAAKRGQLLDYMGSNFYFHVFDYEQQDDSALYFMGRQVDPPPMPDPITWTICYPSIVSPPVDLKSTEWAGTAIFYEHRKNKITQTSVMVLPTVLKGKLIRFGLHVHLNPPEMTESRSQFSTDFVLKQVGWR